MTNLLDADTAAEAEVALTKEFLARLRWHTGIRLTALGVEPGEWRFDEDDRALAARVLAAAGNPCGPETLEFAVRIDREGRTPLEVLGRWDAPDGWAGCCAPVLFSHAGRYMLTAGDMRRLLDRS